MEDLLIFYLISNMKNCCITKHNKLIKASYRLTLNEMRIVFYGLSLINPLSGKFPLEYRIDVKEFSKMFHIESHNIYSLIKETVMEKFWEREFTLGVEKGRKLRVRWLTGVEYADNEGYLKVFINPKLKQFLYHLKENFTTYYIERVSNFKSCYSVRFYEYAIMNLNKSCQDKCQFKLSVQEIRNRLDIGEKYKRFSNFKVFVLETAKKEINKYSDIKFAYKVIKLGRSPNEIEFIITRKMDEKKTLKSTRTNQQHLSPSVIETAKEIARKAGKRWYIYTVEQQFYDYTKKKGIPDNLEGAFIGFVKKKIASKP